MSQPSLGLHEVRPGVLRTPDSAFNALPDFPFQPHYADAAGFRVHYLDEGPAGAPTLLLMHGEPTWSFLYRKMIPVLVAAGYRCVVPDLVGFGRSDKPAQREAYTYQMHVNAMRELVVALNLRDVTLFGQDWGGLIGLRVLADQGDRFTRLVVANTGLPTGDHAPSEGFLKWLEYSQNVPDFPVGQIVRRGCVTALSAAEIAAYDAPFPSDAFKAGARLFPTLVPIRPDDPAAAANRQAWSVLMQWPGKVLTLFSDQDPITAGGFRPFQKLLPGAAGQPHATIERAGHFLQEDQGPEIARRMVEWLQA